MAALQRWLLPRSTRNKTYLEFKRQGFWELIAPGDDELGDLKEIIDQESLFR